MSVVRLLLHLLLLLLLLSGGGAEMSLMPGTLTVLRGDLSRFSCTTSRPQWGAMIWQLSGKTVLTISQQNGPVPSTNPNITAEKVAVSQGEGWSLVLKDTQRQHEGEVTCDLQEVNKKTAHLLVEEKGSVSVLGQSRMALKEQSVEFECHAEGWYPRPTLHWLLNGKQVSRADYNLSWTESGRGQFSVSTNLSVRAASSCDVQCAVSVSAMTAPLRSTVRLTVVAEVLDAGNLTVAVALLGSLSALLSLALLCVATVLCLRTRGRTKGGPQPNIRFGQSEPRRTTVAGLREGKVNPGYSNDRDTFFNELIIGPPIPITPSNSLDKVVCSSGPSFQSDTTSEQRHVRSITTV